MSIKVHLIVEYLRNQELDVHIEVIYSKYPSTTLRTFGYPQGVYYNPTTTASWMHYIPNNTGHLPDKIKKILKINMDYSELIKFTIILFTNKFNIKTISLEYLIIMITADSIVKILVKLKCTFS